VIIPFFDNYPLISQKRADFLLFKMIIELMNEGAHLTTEGLTKIVSLKASMNNGLSDKLKTQFTNIIPVDRSAVVFKDIPDLHWLAGFTEAEGCFFVGIKKSSHKSGFAVELQFSITQHSRDYKLLECFIIYLGCGNFYSPSGYNHGKIRCDKIF
jgi:hypothetical protein